MKTVLVTGATGFIGRHIIPILAEKGFLIHAISHTSSLQSTSKVKYHKKNLLNPTEVHQLMTDIKPTYLLHMAWYAEHGKFWSSEKNLDWVATSLQLVRSFLDNGGKRMVFAGTCAEYEWSANPCDELSTPLKPSTLYGASKASLFNLLQAYAKELSLDWAWGRIFHLYGPHENERRLVSSVILNLLKGLPALCSHGQQYRDFMHVRDVAEAFCSLLESNAQGPVNIVSGQPIQLKEVIGEIAKQLNALDNIKYNAIAPNPSDPLYITATNDRLKTEVNWEQKISLQTGIQQTIASWKNHLNENYVVVN